MKTILKMSIHNNTTAVTTWKPIMLGCIVLRIHGHELGF